MELIVSGLFIYPVKSLSGIPLTEAHMSDRGFRHDRRWMLIDDQLRFLSQREHPVMALIRLRIEGEYIVAAGRHGEASIPLNPMPGERLLVNIWDDLCPAWACGEALDAWFSRELGQACRLVYMPDDSHRQVDLRYAGKDTWTSFSDGYPTLVISEESLADLNARLEQPVAMNRFRPNLVIRGAEPYVEDRLEAFSIGGVEFRGAKPCARCQIVTIDQERGIAGKEPLRTLAEYRRDGNKVLFGMNLLHAGEGILQLGDRLELLPR